MLRQFGQRSVLAITLVLTLVLATAASSVVLAWQASEIFSPATGHAQVVAQGVAQLPPSAAWQVVFHSVTPGTPVTMANAGPGFVLADTGGAVVNANGQETLLAPSEATFATGSDVSLTAVGDRAAGVFTISADPAEQADEAGSGIGVFTGDAFTPPPGVRDFDLVRDRLEPGESTTVVGAQGPVLVLVTLGGVQATGADGAAVDLQVGDAATLDGDVVITAAGQAPATFVAAVIGREAAAASAAGTPGASPVAVVSGSVQLAVFACPPAVKPRDASAETCLPDREAALFQLAAETSGLDMGASRERDGLPTWTSLPAGEYVLRATDFKPGFSRFAVRSLQPADGGGVLVPISAETPDQTLEIYVLASADDAAAAQTAEAVIETEESTPAASQSPATMTPPVTPASSGLDSVIQIETPETGAVETPTPSPAATQAAAGPTEIPSVITIETPVPGSEPTATPRPDPIARSTASPTPRPLATSTAVARPRSGTVEVRVYGCNGGINGFDPANCARAVDGFAVQLVNADGAVFGMDQADVAADGTVTWKGLALDNYLLQLPQMLPGAATYYAPDLQLANNGAGYIVTIDRDAPVATIDVYNLPPAPTPIPTIAPANVDTDGDGLLDADEAAYGASPTLADSDGDGVFDGAEVAAGTNPAVADAAPSAEIDTDSDGILDADEAVFGTDPNLADTDGDGWLDGDEVVIGTSPIDGGNFPSQ